MSRFQMYAGRSCNRRVPQTATPPAGHGEETFRHSSIRFLRSLVFLALLIAVTALTVSAQKTDRDNLPGYSAVQPFSVYEFCKTLASPAYSGRLTGHAGFTAAAEWAAAQFKKWGLQPVNAADGYLLPFPTEYTTVESAEMTLTAAGASTTAAEAKLEIGKDFLPLLFTDSGDQTGEVVFVGWGISAPELSYDDYAGMDVQGKFALCFRGTPDPSEPRYTDHDQHRTRMKKAKEKGALGIIYIYEEPIANPNGDWISGFTPAVISQKTADLILKEKGLAAANLRGDLTKYKRPLSFQTKTKLRVSVRSTHVAEGTGYNVAAWVEGSDPVLKNDYVIVGAHADHTGTVMGILFPGAEDNASGTAVAMEIGRIFAAMPKRPKRSVVIVLFGGEESGLKGSEHFAGHLPAQLGKPVAMLNFDMVGAGDGMRCGYSENPPELKRILDEADAVVKTVRAASPIRRIGVQSSDFAPFFRKGIPCLSFVSNGPHLSYHQSGDTIYRINPDMLADAARIGFLTALRLADAAGDR